MVITLPRQTLSLQLQHEETRRLNVENYRECFFNSPIMPAPLSSLVILHTAPRRRRRGTG